MSRPEPRPVRSHAELIDVVERRARRIWWARHLGTASIVVLVLAAAAVPVMAGRGEPVVTVAGGEPEPTPTSQDPPTTTSEPPPETTTTAPQPAPEPEPAPDPATPPPQVEVVTPSTEPADGPAGRGVGGDSATEPYDWPHCPSDEPTQAPPDGMVVELISDQTTYAVGEEITFTLTVRNEGDQPVENTSGPPRADVVIEQGAHTVWRATFGGRYSGQVDTRAWEPGEEQSDNYTWDQRMCDPHSGEYRTDPLPPGTYGAHGFWRDSDGAWESTTIEFEVV